MSQRTNKLGIGIAVLVFTSLACNFLTGGSDSEPASEAIATAANPTESVDPGPDSEAGAEPQSEPTALPAPTDPPAAPESSEGPATLDLSNPALFAEPPINTYRTDMLFSFEGLDSSGQTITGTTIVEGVQRTNPRESNMTFTTLGNAVVSGDDTYTFALIGDTSYFSTASTGCVAGPASEIDNPFDLLLDTGDFFTGDANRIMPDEVVNNVETYVYKITPDNLDPTDPANLDVSEAEGKLYVAKDGFYVVRAVMTGLGSSEVLSGDPDLEGDLYYELNFTEIDEAISISPPEGCPGVEASDIAFPILEDAYELFSLGSELVSYESDFSFDEAVDFYQTEMAAEGWTYKGAESFIISPSALLVFSNEAGEQVTVLIGEGSTEGSLSVLISEYQ